MFSKFSIREWKDFNKEAAKVMVGKQNEKPVPKWYESVVTAFGMVWKAQKPPSKESTLTIAWQQHLLWPLNKIEDTKHQEWAETPNQTKNSLFRMRTPDFSLQLERSGSSSTQTRDNDEDLLVVGGVKTPYVYLGSDLTAEQLTNRIKHKDSCKDVEALAFFQQFSYILHTEKGLGFLTNYDHTRFFRMNLKKKEILMSPVVRINQRLDKDGTIPHLIQALAYMNELRYPTKNEHLPKRAVKRGRGFKEGFWIKFGGKKQVHRGY